MAEKFPEVVAAAQKVPRRGQGRIDRRHLRRSRWARPSAARRTSGRSSSAGRRSARPWATRWSRSSKRRSSAIRSSRKSSPGPATASPAWPKSIRGAGRASPSWSSTPSAGAAWTAPRSPRSPRTRLFGYSPDLENLATQPAFARLQALGKPLIFTWEEFGWESPETPDYLTAPAKYQAFAQKSPVEFVTCGQYLDKYGAQPKESIYLPMEAWNKSLTWGIGGDQLRILDRKVEAVLLAAETFAAVAYALDVGTPSDCFPLEKAWEHKLASQSHDVGLCEYTRWQGLRMAPLDRVEDRHNFTWGAIGFDHLDAAQQQGREMLDQVMDRIAASINSKTSRPASHVVTVFNPCGHDRDDLVLTGRIHSVRPYGSIRFNGLPPAIAAPSEADSFRRFQPAQAA